MAIETGEQLDNSQDKVSNQQVSEMFQTLNKKSENKGLSQFGKEFQNHLQTKNTPDKNTELVA